MMISIPHGDALALFPHTTRYSSSSFFPHVVYVTPVVSSSLSRPASYKESRPYLFREYEETMTKMWVDILNYTSSSEQMMMDDNDDGPPPTFYLRSMNYNPLGGSIASCPPTDWRSPVVVDGYNTILRRLAEHFNIPFIDNIFIVGPMWDSAKDWSHYNNEVGHRMAAYIVARVLHLV